MKNINVFVVVLYISVLCVHSVQAQPSPIPMGDYFRQEGNASWYGNEFEGRRTASGEIFEASKLTAAHPTLPFGTQLLITNKNNNRQVSVRVNDRGPFVASRIIDVSRAAAEQLDMIYSGVAPVLVETMHAGRVYTQDVPYVPAPPVYLPPPPPQIIYSPPPEQPPQPAPQPQVIVIAPPAPQQNNPPVIVFSPPDAYPQDVPQNTPVIVIQQPEAPAQPPAPQPNPQIVFVSPPAPEPPVPAPQPNPQIVFVSPPAPEPPAPAPQPNPQIVFVSPPPPPAPIRLIPPINPNPGRVYKLQVGAFSLAQNAVGAYTRLKDAGLNPIYERIGEKYGVVLPEIMGTDVQPVSERLRALGFTEAIIREVR